MQLGQELIYECDQQAFEDTCNNGPKLRQRQSIILSINERILELVFFSHS